MAEIFLATQTGIQGFEKSVVIKRVLPNLSSEGDFINMFLDEARIAARLEHPNIVRIYDLGEVNGQYFIAMEYIAGEDLASVIQQAKRQKVYVPVEFCADAVLGAAEALMFAHDMEDSDGKPLNLVHRDISPSNILVTYQGTVKLVDFGIARAESNVSKTEGGQVKGKIQYLAPEQCRGQVVDNRTDIYAMGIVLHELLTCKRLYQRDNQLLTMNAILQGEVAAPSTIRPDVPPELDEIVLRALQREPENRYQSAAELAADLSVFLVSRGWNRATDSVMFLTQLFGDPRKRAKLRMAKGQKLAEAEYAASTSVPAVGSVVGARTATGEFSFAPGESSGAIPAVTPGGKPRTGASGVHGVRPPTSPSQVNARPPSNPRPGSSPSNPNLSRPPSDPNNPRPGSNPSGPVKRPTMSSLPSIPSIPPLVPMPEAPPVASAATAEPPTAVPEAPLAPPAPPSLVDRFKRKDPKVIAPVVGAAAMLLAILVLVISRSGSDPVKPPPTTVVKGPETGVKPPGKDPVKEPVKEPNKTPDPNGQPQIPAGLMVGGVKFSGVPDGAKVTVDGNIVANPSSENFFSAGVRQVKVESRAHLPYEAQVNVVVGKVTEVTLELKARPIEARGTIEISCQPWCQITMDGRDTGKTSPARLSATVGTHTLVLSNPPAGLAKKITVTVTENGTVKKSIKLDD